MLFAEVIEPNCSKAMEGSGRRQEGRCPGVRMYITEDALNRHTGLIFKPLVLVVLDQYINRLQGKLIYTGLKTGATTDRFGHKIKARKPSAYHAT